MLYFLKRQFTTVVFSYRTLIFYKSYCNEELTILVYYCQLWNSQAMCSPFFNLHTYTLTHTSKHAKVNVVFHQFLYNNWRGLKVQLCKILYNCNKLHLPHIHVKIIHDVIQWNVLGKYAYIMISAIMNIFFYYNLYQNICYTILIK